MFFICCKVKNGNYCLKHSISLESGITSFLRNHHVHFLGKCSQLSTLTQFPATKHQKVKMETIVSGSNIHFPESQQPNIASCQTQATKLYMASTIPKEDRQKVSAGPFCDAKSNIYWLTVPTQLACMYFRVRKSTNSYHPLSTN